MKATFKTGATGYQGATGPQGDMGKLNACQFTNIVTDYYYTYNSATQTLTFFGDTDCTCGLYVFEVTEGSGIDIEILTIDGCTPHDGKTVWLLNLSLNSADLETTTKVNGLGVGETKTRVCVPFKMRE